MFFRRLNWNVVGWFNIVSWISYAVIIAGLITMGVHWATRGTPLRLGLSFTGGTDVTVHFTRSVAVADVKNAMSSIGIADAQVNTVTKAGDAGTPRYTIATQTDFGNNTSKLWTALDHLAPVDRSQSEIAAVGPSLSHEYLIKALEALVIAIAIQFLYIAFRFGWNYIFGLVTVIALARDSLMMIGIYAIADKRVDDAFLAAVLTVVGYSVMDTIVILDRIRENTKLMAGEAFDRIVNTSILQTMTRSVNTLATVVITLVALLAFGGFSLQNFAFALLVGICSGGYHSIFYSAPLVAVMRKRQLAGVERKRALGVAARNDGGARPRTVAEARAQGGETAADRDAIVAARKARRERERAAAARPAPGPARYKKRRPETPAAIGTIEPEFDVDDAQLDEEHAYEEHAYDAPQAFDAEMDPLDAQRAGVHERDYDLGHEEIHLNLEDEEHLHPHPHPHDAEGERRDS